MKLASLVVLAALTLGGNAFAQARVSKITQYHTTVGTTTAAAIPSANILSGLVGYSICNDAVNTSTYLIVGTTADAATDGRTMAPGACYECKNCSAGSLLSLKVKGQAASNGYSVTQFRQ